MNRKLLQFFCSINRTVEIFTILFLKLYKLFLKIWKRENKNMGNKKCTSDVLHAGSFVTPKKSVYGIILQNEEEYITNVHSVGKFISLTKSKLLVILNVFSKIMLTLIYLQHLKNPFTRSHQGGATMAARPLKIIGLYGPIHTTPPEAPLVAYMSLVLLVARPRLAALPLKMH